MNDKVPTESELEAESVVDALLQNRIVEAIGDAVQAAIRDHKRAGNSIAEWRGGRVVIVPPEEIDGWCVARWSGISRNFRVWTSSSLLIRELLTPAT